MKPVLPKISSAGIGALLSLFLGAGAPAFAQEGQDPPDGEEQPERIPGIGKPPSADQGADHVLRRPSKAEREELAVMCERAADAVEAILADGADAAMARFNGQP